MEDYKNMYTSQSSGEEPPRPDPKVDPIGAFPEDPDWNGVRSAAEPVLNPAAPSDGIPDAPSPEAPAPGVSPAPPQPSSAPAGAFRNNTGAFYGDPNAPTGQTPDYSWQVPPVVQPEKPITMNRRIYTMCAVIAVLIFLLCVYCICSDVLHGALSSDSPTPITVTLEQQKKPELDPDDENVTPEGEYTVRGVAEAVSPSIVEVYTYSDASGDLSALAGTGSGIIISEDGYIVTNAHVVQGESFSVTLSDDEDRENFYPAELIGSDAKTDLAVLKIKANGLTPAILGDSDETYVGENVVAIGNPAGLTNTVTKGIVSAIGRKVRAESNSFRMECIQTDAAISPGNSGGALVNMYGQVIGITSSKYASMYSTGYEGLGFAISINQAIPIVTDLMEQGYVGGRYRIGIVLSSAGAELTQQEFAKQHGAAMPDALKNGIWISEISEDCDIYNTELQPGDFILEMQGVPVAGYDDVIEALEGCEGGSTVTAHCARYEEDGTVRYFDITFQLEEDTSGNY